MKAQFQIVIPKRNLNCIRCKTSFSKGQEIYSQLIENSQKWLRQDACLSCFLPLESAVIWKHTIGTEEKVLPEIQDHIAKALDLLEKLIESERVSDHEEALLLALYLVRKKVLVHRVKMGLYENLETGEMFLIPKINSAHFSAHAVGLRLQEKL